MNFSKFLAQRLVLTPAGNRNPVIGIATGGIALGMAVMIVAVMIVNGFRNEITDKVTGFGAHIQITGFDNNNSYENQPIHLEDKFVSELKNNPDIRSVNEFATKAGIIKTDTEIHGCVLKGVGADYDWSFFRNKLKEGTLIHPGDSAAANEIMISRSMADKLQLHVGDKMVIYFIEQPPRIRRLTIKGIFETGLTEFDDIYVYCDLNLLRKLYNWEDNMAGGYEINLHDENKIAAVTDLVYHQAGYEYYTTNIKEQYPQIFNWLELQNINVTIIIALIICVAGISMITTLLIIILENTSLIGILKSLGTKDSTIRKTFLYLSVPVIGKGVLIGNIIGCGLCLLQQYTGLIELSQESYYVSTVPIDFSLLNLLLLNVGTVVAGWLLLLGPSMIITRIQPARVIRFD